VHVGVTFPHSKKGADPKAIQAYAQAAEDLGYKHLLAYDHVLGADPTNREGEEPFLWAQSLTWLAKENNLSEASHASPRRPALVRQSISQKEHTLRGGFSRYLNCCRPVT
jgi:hypothetical protein